MTGVSQTSDPGPSDAETDDASLRIRLEPEDAILPFTLDAPATQKFRVFAQKESDDEEIDVTDYAVFYVSENPQLGSFPDDGPAFESNADTPRGGYARVTALVSDSDGTIVSATTAITLRLTATLPDPRQGISLDLPSDPTPLFSGEETTDNAPRIVYPNSGVLLPPNMNQLEVHFRPGPDSTLFEVAFDSAVAELRYYVRCGEPVDGGCVFSMNNPGYRLLADSNRGSRPVRITVRGSNDSGQWVAASEPIDIQFTDTDVNGGLYYWTTSDNSAIMRFDFGAQDAEPEVFLAPNRYGMAERCVGCHAISPDGRRVVASIGGQGIGGLVYINDLSVPRTDASFVDRNGTETGDEESHIQFASFNPDGSQFVAVFGDTGLPDRNKLWFHDGNTGARIPGAEVSLPFEPDHPDWSGDGNAIVMSNVGIHRTSQRPSNCGISILRRAESGGWGEPVDVIPVVNGDGKSRYNPDFVPDDAFFVFSESHCSSESEETGEECDGDVDPSAKTWAALPEAGATPIFLARAAAPGVEDGDVTDLSDTFPRSSPFEGRYLGKDQALADNPDLRHIYWITITSTRRTGLRNAERRQQLWMFAVDGDKILAGDDGSFPAFHLPFQDWTTRNHIGQWTQAIVTDKPPPPPVPTPPPPPPPTPRQPLE